MTDSEIQSLPLYTEGNNIKLTAGGMYLNDPTKTEFKDNEYVTRYGSLEALSSLFYGVSASLDSYENIKELV